MNDTRDLFNITYQLSVGAREYGAKRLKRLAELGVRTVAVPAEADTDSLSELAGLCDDACLRIGAVSAAHDPSGEHSSLSAAVSNALRTAGRFGASLVRVQTPVLSGLASQNEVGKALEHLRALEADLETYNLADIPVGLEPGPGENVSRTGARDLFHGLDSEHLGISLNPSKLVCGSEESMPPRGPHENLRYDLRRFLSCYYFTDGEKGEAEAAPFSLWNSTIDFVSVVFRMHFSRDEPPDHIIVQDSGIERLLEGNGRDYFYIRNFLSALSEYSLGHPGLRKSARNLAHIEERIPWGSAELIPDRLFPVSSYTNYSLRITVGPGGVEQGGEIRVQQPILWHAGRMQTGFPQSDGYVTVTASSSGAELLLFPRPYPLGELVIGVRGGRLCEGDILTVLMGDTSEGSRGIVSNSDLADLTFTVAVRQSAGSGLTVMADTPVLRITNGPAAHLSVIAPSVVLPGEAVPVTVRADDSTGYPCTAPGDFAFSGSIELRKETARSGESAVPVAEGEISLQETDAGVVHPLLSGDYVNMKPDSVCRFIAEERENGLCGTSNPVVCRENPKRRLYWGEIHSHSTESDGRLPIDFLYRYARDYAALDFASSGDHGLANSPEKWDTAREYAARYNDPSRFVTLLGTEFSKPAPYGDRNAYFKTLDVPYFTGSDIHDIWDWVADNGGLLIPHQLASPPMAIDWHYHDPRVERIAEIASCHGNFEKPDMPYGVSERHGIRKGLLAEGSFYQDALARGYHLGVIGSSDTHDTHTGHTPYGAWRSTPLAAVWAEELTRDSVFQAMWDRRCYATTGARIIMEMEVEGAPMGSELIRAESYNGPVRITASVTGTAQLESVDIVRNNEDIFTVRPESGETEIEFSDTLNEIRLPELCYYIRVAQSDGEMAWSSPVWIATGDFSKEGE